jgi:hypothetical protein
MLDILIEGHNAPEAISVGRLPENQVSGVRQLRLPICRMLAIVQT